MVRCNVTPDLFGVSPLPKRLTAQISTAKLSPRPPLTLGPPQHPNRPLAPRLDVAQNTTLLLSLLSSRGGRRDGHHTPSCKRRKLTARPAHTPSARLALCTTISRERNVCTNVAYESVFCKRGRGSRARVVRFLTNFRARRGVGVGGARAGADSDEGRRNSEECF